MLKSEKKNAKKLKKFATKLTKLNIKQLRKKEKKISKKIVKFNKKEKSANQKLHGAILKQEGSIEVANTHLARVELEVDAHVQAIDELKASKFQKFFDDTRMLSPNRLGTLLAKEGRKEKSVSKLLNISITAQEASLQVSIVRLEQAQHATDRAIQQLSRLKMSHEDADQGFAEKMVLQFKKLHMVDDALSIQLIR